MLGLKLIHVSKRGHCWSTLWYFQAYRAKDFDVASGGAPVIVYYVLIFKKETNDRDYEYLTMFHQKDSALY